ncbi:acyl-CoA dehydrogenase family protein [Rhodopseudomonas sp. NSM]|uniref:acyl-CoA dehydrogenase family protein n=1 Tax=Rhodopseudomonas sp. NSM TaxID=3457630 RepID=UPI00403615F1
MDRTELFARTAFDEAEKADATAAIDSTLWAEFRRSGLAMAAFPERLGGSGLCENERQGALCTVLRMVGGGDLSIGRLFEGHVNAISLVCRYGTEAQMAALAADVANGALCGVWGADDAAGLKIVGAGASTELRGRKILASGAGFVTRPIVTAKAGDDQLMCLLRLAPDHPVDLSGWSAQGMRSTATGAVELSGIRIGEDEVVGVAGDFMRQPYFSGGAWRFCAAHLGAMERLVELFRDHLVSRGRGEDPYQLQRVADCVASARTTRFWVEEAARRFGSGDKDATAIVGFANMTRMVTERSALDIMEAVQRGVGLPSFIRPSPVERICRDLATYLRQPVPDLAMSDAARSWLTSSEPVGDF